MLAVFYSLIGWRELQLVAVQDIGVVAAKALLSPESKEFKNQTIDLSAGPYEYNDCLDAFEKAQGTRPWYLGWLPGFLIHLLPFDMRQMMYCEWVSLLLACSVAGKDWQAPSLPASRNIH